MLHGWTLLDYDFDTGANSGDQTITLNLDPHDLSRAKMIRAQLTLTTMDAASDDTLDVFLDETREGTYWNERLHSHQLDGSMTPTEIREYVVSADTPLDTTDEAYESTGSAGASDLAAGSVRNGPFAPKLPGTSGPWAPQTTHRVRFVVDDDDSDARFAGNLLLTAFTEV